MKSIQIYIITLMSFFIYQKGYSQTINWNSLKDSKYILTANIGWDYSVSYSLGYAYQIKTTLPVVLTSTFSIPSGEKLLDDFKTKVGGQVVFFNKSNLKGSFVLNGIYRRYVNPLVTLQNFGSELKVVFGYYKSKWFVAGDAGFDKAIVTHFKHSETYKETVFADVKDGWYEPSSGGNFQYGIQTGWSFNQSDIIFNIGVVTTQDFKTSPLIPYYLMLGYNYRIN